MKAAIKYVIDRFGPIALGLIVFVPLYVVFELVGIYRFGFPPGSPEVLVACYIFMTVTSFLLGSKSNHTQKSWVPQYISPEERSAINSSVFRSLVWILLMSGIAALAVYYDVVPVGYGIAGAVTVAAFFASLELRKSTANA